MAVEINIPNNDHALTPGMFANVDLIIDTHPNALTIPSNAILRDDEGYYIYTVQNDTARRVRVTTGSEEASRLEIRSGLDSIPLVITTGQQFVRNGGPVLVQK
jgi:membrane fusion protein (multidrug efflux system)